MKLFKKTYWLIYPILIVLFMLVFDQIYKIESLPLKVGICAILAFFVSPRKKIVLTETGKTIQITWIFLKKPIIIE